MDESLTNDDILIDHSENNNVIKELFNKKDINIKTEFISIEETAAFAKWEWLSTHGLAKETELDELLRLMMENRLSNKRKSRREFIEAGKLETSMQERKKGILERFGFGGKKEQQI